MNNSNTKPFLNTYIPMEWEVRKIGNLSNKVGRGITPSGGEKVYKQSGRIFIRSQNIGWGQLLLDDVAYIDEVTHNSFSSTEIVLNDVLLNITGASIGRSVVANEQIVNGNVNQHVCIIRTKPDVLHPVFLNLFLTSPIGQNLINSYQAGGNRQGLNFEQIKSFPIPLPLLQEQTAIAHVLSTWDNAINNCQQLIAQKELQKKWMVQQLLTGKKRLKGFNVAVEFHPLGKYIKEVSERNKNNIVTKVLSVTNSRGFINQSEQFDRSVASEDSTNYKIVRRGQFAYNPSRVNVGSLDLLRTFEQGILSPMYIVFETNPKYILPNFLYYHLKSSWFMGHIPMFVQGIVRDSLSFDGLCGMKFFIPSIQEQTAILQVLQAVDSEIELLKEKLEHLKGQKKGLMQVLLTGKKRLKVKNE